MPSVEPSDSVLANSPYKIMEKAIDSKPKKMARYLDNRTPSNHAMIPDVTADISRSKNTSVTFKKFAARPVV